MKTCFKALLLLLALPIAVQAQFTSMVWEGTIAITGYTGPGGAVTIPSTINGVPVTDIWLSAFLYCTSLTSVTIPNSVIGIEDGAFAWCNSLTTITIPNSVSYIGDYAFEHCSSLTNISLFRNVPAVFH
jgi:hypothetical protein